MNTRKGFCYEIFKNLAFTSHNTSVSYSPCSLFNGSVDVGVSPYQAWCSSNRQSIIKLVNDNKLIPGCQYCYNEEAAGRKSRRIGAQENYEKFEQNTEIDNLSGPESIDYSVGNLCNLKCIICGPNNSSSWISDYQKLNPTADITPFLYIKQAKTEITNDTFLSNVKRIHFHGGGEPLLSNDHVNLLKRVDDAKGLADVRVFYNTNTTVRVSDDILKLWEKCKLIEIYFSIDDIGERFEYQRTNAQWSQVENNIRWYYSSMPHNHMFYINCVWGYLNLYYLDEISQWHKTNLPTNRYGDPCKLYFQKAIGTFSINHLSSELLTVLKNKFIGNENLLKLLSDVTVSNNGHVDFWNKINKIDQIRNRDFKKICKEWSDLLI